jgi:phospholipid/cholesterol/gamma-HCH transport system permease protein
VFADVLALFGAAWAGLPLLGVDPGTFYDGLTSGLLGLPDVVHGLVKSIAFGVGMALASSQFGMATEGGAPGVGRAVNATVVTTASFIFILDYLVSFAVK